ncbi:hypothetical protein GZ78_03900 [Endozoicomonas numazuensis]|uniref:Uncharacterized protein n=1 Tax=Endozoicomonas numazuensis TaxID=1137799 RepID=A0A081NL29_9GAMM|nr:hypothetical protein GZ78_03900 [Endozoicomonas numazuensis]
MRATGLFREFLFNGGTQVRLMSGCLKLWRKGFIESIFLMAGQCRIASRNALKRAYCITASLKVGGCCIIVQTTGKANLATVMVGTEEKRPFEQRRRIRHLLLVVFFPHTSLLLTFP